MPGRSIDTYDADTKEHLLVTLREKAMHATAIGFSITDARKPDNPLIWVNEAFSAMTGYEPDEVVGRNCRFLQGSGTDPEAVAAMRAAVAQGVPITLVLKNYRSNGTPFWNEVSINPVFDAHGSVASFVGVQSDVTTRIEADRELRAAHEAERSARAEADEAREQQRLLAEATGLLSATLDVGVALDRLLHLVVPLLGDWAIVTMLDDAGVASVGAVRHRDGRAEEMRTFSRLMTANLTPDTAQGRVLRTGRPLLVESFDDGYAGRVGVQDEVLEQVADLGGSSAMVVPLVARRSVLGTLTLFAASRGRTFTSADLDVAADLGRRAGLALDNARLYEREHRVAEALQRSLLPDLPDVADADIAVRYLAGDEAASVGGDFYEVLELPDGALGLAVGDVVGHDITAAAQMGHLRGLLRACAWDTAVDDGADPAKILSRTDRLVQGLRVASMATLVYARLDRPRSASDCWTLTYSNGGHPHAMLKTPDGVVQLLDGADGLLLGVTLDQPRTSTRVPAPCGSLLVFYTDGLVERRGEDLDESTAALRRTVAGLAAGASVEQVCDALIEHAGADRDDDTAVLVVRLR